MNGGIRLPGLRSLEEDRQALEMARQARAASRGLAPVAPVLPRTSTAQTAKRMPGALVPAPPRLPTPTAARPRRPAATGVRLPVPAAPAAPTVPAPRRPAAPRLPAPPARPPIAEPEEEAEELVPRPPTIRASSFMPPLQGPPLEDGESSTDRMHCPVCGMMADLSRLDSAPHPVDLFVQVFGGPVKSGKLHVLPSGHVIDRRFNRRGSIAYFPATTPDAAEAVQARLVEIAHEIIQRAEAGSLVRL